MSKKSLEEKQVSAATRILNLALGDKRNVQLQMLYANQTLTQVMVSSAFDVLQPYEETSNYEEPLVADADCYKPDGASTGGGSKIQRKMSEMHLAGPEKDSIAMSECGSGGAKGICQGEGFVWPLTPSSMSSSSTGLPSDELPNLPIFQCSYNMSSLACPEKLPDDILQS